MRKIRVLASSCMLLCIMTAGCSQGDVSNGEARAVTCNACHGGNGMVTTPNTPRLAGQSQGYIAKQLRAFRDGDRKDPIMEPLAASLTDSQIDDIAAYYESLDSRESP
jgi:cytochrome c553